MRRLKPVQIGKIQNNYLRYREIPSYLKNGNPQEMPAPYLSIAVPTYNRPHLLKEALESVFSQEPSPCVFEVIVVVDGEYDDPVIASKTRKVIESFSHNPQLLCYQNEQRLGLFGTMNRCIELARGKWVAFLHDDDLLKPYYVRLIHSMLKKNSDVGAITATVDYFGDSFVQRPIKSYPGRVWLKRLYQKYWVGKLMPITWLDGALTGSNHFGPPSCGTVFNRDIALELGGFNEADYPSADWFFLHNLSLYSKVYRSLQPLGAYRWQENESLKRAVLIGFIKDRKNFSETIKNNSILGAFFYRLFGREQHFLAVEWIIQNGKNYSFSPEDFNEICEYRKRPLRLFLFKGLICFHNRLKMMTAVLRGLLGKK